MSEGVGAFLDDGGAFAVILARQDHHHRRFTPAEARLDSASEATLVPHDGFPHRRPAHG